jgi:putative nucleotidyltransferase with HDIG domain
MNSAAVFEQIEKMGDLPSLPQTLLRIQKVATDDRSCADDLAECILKDQALTMRVLKVVNSAMYQRRNQEQVRTVRRAVIVMGFETVRKLALGLSVFDMMSKLSRSPYLAVITRHSLVAAGCAQILAEASGRVAPEEAFVTALIHDIGKVVLLECSPEHMDYVLNDLGGGVPALEAERRHFGITHDRAGRRLAARWKLPQELQNAIGDHHDIDPLNPPRNLDPMLGTIVYADAMSRFTCLDEDHDHEFRIIRRATKALGIPRGRIDDIVDRAAREIGDLAERMGVGLGDLQDYGQLVNVDGGVVVAPRRMSPEAVARRTAQQLELYRDVGAGLAERRSQGDLLQMILAGAVDILGFERVVLLQVDRADRVLRPLRSEGVEAQDLADQLLLPLTRETGALALSVLDHRTYHVPMAASPAYDGLAGDELLSVARCTGFVASPVITRRGVDAVLYADCGPGGDDVVAEQATELAGLAQQIGLVLGAALRARDPEPVA